MVPAGYVNFLKVDEWNSIASFQEFLFIQVDYQNHKNKNKKQNIY